ncbi:hypothetical protein [Ferroacidibacillus organovorans]|uniref:Uncharacterized protein n=1 Tax=Ferroacidibacillus organovorans TaxID=1765683 RepID=A0A853K7R3_9BACL|nr:hypothetical protein [Ferroacidibacillus organovorans]KYP79976.1 hypothetical protein AYJ22_13045 [Ferroacidibacillus organovorans]OAG92906.1 hypothetical protein AYW79_12760 [Ferroacidibacillus organovorans]
MLFEGINTEAVCGELKRIMDDQFVSVLTDVGYITRAKVNTVPDLDSLDERQQAVAYAIRRMRNERILELIFDSSKYKTKSEKLHALTQGWDRALLSAYLYKFDFDVDLSKVESVISEVMIPREDIFAHYMAFELPGYIRQQVITIDDTWMVRPKTKEFYGGTDQNTSWLTHNFIPSVHALDNENALLFRKIKDPLGFPNGPDPSDSQLLLAHLSPLVARSHDMYIIREHNETRHQRVHPMLKWRSHYRLGLPVTRCYLDRFPDDITWLLRHESNLSDHPKVRAALERYALALHYYTSSLSPGIEFDQAIHDAVIGLETLVINSNAEVGYRFQTVLARLMEEEGVYCRDFLKLIYQLRSDVAHQGRTHEKRRASRTVVFQAISLLNGVIRWYLAKSETMTAKQIDTHLAEMPFGFKKDVAESPWGSVSSIEKDPPIDTGPWTSKTAVISD